MPFIDARLTVPATPAQKEQLKSAFGQAVTALHKSETYLMVQIADECDLWMGGRRLDKGAYLAVSLFGSAAPADYENICGGKLVKKRNCVGNFFCRFVALNGNGFKHNFASGASSADDVNYIAHGGARFGGYHADAPWEKGYLFFMRFIEKPLF